MGLAAAIGHPHVTVDEHHPAHVDAELETQLMALTLPNGQMAGVYRTCQTRANWNGRVYVARIDGEPVGWALRWKNRYMRAGRWTVFVYVDARARRQGVGRALVEAARQRLRGDVELRGHCWNDASTHFWTSLEHDGTAVAVRS